MNLRKILCARIRHLSFALVASGLVASASAQTSIMPLGDSNTRGKFGSNYRSYLRDKLINQAGYNFDYVGSGVSVGGAHGPGPESSAAYTSAQIAALGNDLEHEGWGGYTIANITPSLNAWIASANPDIVLLMLGTNDYAKGFGSGAIGRLDAMIGQIFQARPGVTLLVASIPPMTAEYAGLNQAVELYNRQIPSIVNDYAGAGHDIYFTDVHTALDPAIDFGDGLHPNAQGYEKIGGAWFKILSQLAAGNSQPQISFTVNGPQGDGFFLENEDLTIAAQGFDSDGFVSKVVFYANGSVIGETVQEPHILVWPQVAAGKYEITAVAYDDDGFPAHSYPLKIRVGEPVPTAALVVGNATGISPADQRVADFLNELGLVTEIHSELEVASTGVGDATLVVLSASVNSNRIGTTFRDISLPVVTFEPLLFDDMGLTGPLRGTDYEAAANQTQIQITDSAHPMAAGLSGLVQAVANGQGSFSWGKPAGDVFSIAHLTGQPDKAAVFGISRNGLLVNGDAAADRRVGLFFGESTASNLTENGRSLFDAAILWSLGGSVAGGGDEPDVNRPPSVAIEGGDRLFESTLPASMTISAGVLDDGLPLGNPLVLQWTSTSADVTFSNPESPTTGVTFSGFGTYELIFTAFDGEASSSDQISVTVVDPSGPPVRFEYSQNPALYLVGESVLPNMPSHLGADITDYEITPELPDGLEFDTATGILSGTPTASLPTTTFFVTATNGRGSSTVELMLTVQIPPPEVLMIVGNLTLNPGDQAIRSWFVSQGYAVTLKTFSAAQPVDAVGKDLVMITSTGNSGHLGGRLRDVTVPVIVSEPYIFDDMELTPAGNDVKMGIVSGETRIEVISPSHPLAGGLNGFVDVVASGSGFFAWGVPGPGAVRIATLGSNPSRASVFGYEIGDALASGRVAASRRVGLFLGDLTAANFTPDGWLVFTAAVQWALVGGGFDPNGPPAQLAYSQNPAIYPLEGVIPPNVPTVEGGAVVSYQIIPELPAGLSFDTTTGIITGTPTVVQPPTSFVVTAINGVGSTSTELVLTVQGPPLGEILLVVRSLTLDPGDRAIRDWFEIQGYAVTLRTFPAVQAVDAVGKDLIMITSTGNSGQLGGRLRDVAVPVIVAEPYVFDEMELTASSSESLAGTVSGESQIQVINPTHPLAAGLDGLVNAVGSGEGFFTWGVPGGDAVTIATLGSDSSRGALFAYESGSSLATGRVAPHRRLGIFTGDLTAPNFTADGWRIFSGAVEWSLEGGGFDPEGPPAQLTYSMNPASYALDQEILPNLPSTQGGDVDSYSITPALPSGLVFDGTTGIITGTPTTSLGSTRFVVTALNEVGSTTTELLLTVPGPPIGDVLLVVGNPTLNSGDRAMRNWFEGQGYTVTVRSFAAVQAVDAVGKNLVVITSTGSSGDLGAKLRDVAVPVIVSESFVFDDMELTTPGNSLRYGNLNGESQISIINPGHPLAAGLSGVINIVGSNEGFITWGVPGTAAIGIATLGSDPSRMTVFGYETGSLLTTGRVAAHRRLALFMGDLTAANFTAQGWQIFAAGVQWALEGGGVDSQAPPSQLGYSQNPAVYPLGQAITPNLPSSNGGPVDSYTIAPALPDGLIFNSVTGVISGTPTLATVATAYSVTALNAGGSTTAEVMITCQGPPLGEILMVVGNQTLNTGDQAMRNWLVGQGYAVTLQSFASAQAVQAEGKDLVLITATGNSGSLGGRFRDVPVPVIVSESFVFDDMELTTPGNTLRLGNVNGESRITIVNAGHPLAAGLSGVVDVVASNAGFFTWGVPGGGAVSIATLASDPSRSAVFAYDQGSLLTTGRVAAHRRLAMFMGDLTAANFTAQGWQIFAAGVQWALEGGGAVDPSSPPTQLSYSQNPAVYPIGVAITPNLPSSSGGSVDSYSIAPALPEGLVFDTATGIISGIPTVATAATNHIVTALNADGSTTAELVLTCQGPPPGEVLMVVGNLTLNTGDQALRNWFVAQGFGVTLRNFSTALAADAEGKDLVMITATGNSGNLGGRLRDVAVPVIVSESFVFDDMELTTPGNNLHMGTVNGESRVSIVNPSHPLASGLNGVVDVVGSTAGFFTWGVPGSTAVSIATLNSDPSRTAVFAYESGSLLTTGRVAAHRRLAMFMGDVTAANFTAEGWQIFSAGVQWALGEGQ